MVTGKNNPEYISNFLGEKIGTLILVFEAVAQSRL